VGIYDNDNNGFDDLDEFFSGGGGAKGISWKLARKGDSIQGIILDMEVRDKVDPNTKAVVMNEYGKPKQVLVITLATDMRDDEIEGDDGTRRAFLQGNALFEFKKFLRENKIGKPARGGRFFQQLIGTKPSNFASPQNLFACKYGAPTSESLAVLDTWLAKKNGGQTADPFASSTPAATAQPAARATTLNSMRAGGNGGFDDSPPF
jgi:hypothetical protein